VHGGRVSISDGLCGAGRNWGLDLNLGSLGRSLDVLTVPLIGLEGHTARTERGTESFTVTKPKRIEPQQHWEGSVVRSVRITMKTGTLAGTRKHYHNMTTRERYYDMKNNRGGLFIIY
jgi:hypothetical protein